MKKILVGLDASERAPVVLRRALELARAMDAKLIAVRSVGLPLEFPIEALSIEPGSLPSRLVALAQTSLAALTADVPPALLVRAEARLGAPWETLCDVAKEEGAELIVVGTHGYRGIDRVIGTTAARVVNHAPCSVFVVRDRAAT